MALRVDGGSGHRGALRATCAIVQRQRAMTASAPSDPESACAAALARTLAIISSVYGTYSAAKLTHAVAKSSMS